MWYFFDNINAILSDTYYVESNGNQYLHNYDNFRSILKISCIYDPRRFLNTQVHFNVRVLDSEDGNIIQYHNKMITMC